MCLDWRLVMCLARVTHDKARVKTRTRVSTLSALCLMHALLMPFMHSLLMHSLVLWSLFMLCLSISQPLLYLSASALSLCLSSSSVF
mmetsp:Transcript_42434/g.62413  ORF Transcript_42434/g.62413 Transcript_42434/m.62413 type:complete len:87 (-) Transcript_42434:167-427(-)